MKLLLQSLLFGQTALRHGGNDAAGLNFIITVNTNNFFCNVIHATNVVTVRRNGDHTVIDLEVQAFKDANHFLFGKIDAEEAVRLLKTEWTSSVFSTLSTTLKI